LYLDEVCLFYPELKLVMAHGADPWWGEAIRLLLKYPNLYMMTSAYAPKYLPPELIHFMNTRGAHKVLFASDHPFLSFERCLAEAGCAATARSASSAPAARWRSSRASRARRRCARRWSARILALPSRACADARQTCRSGSAELAQHEASAVRDLEGERVTAHVVDGVDDEVVRRQVARVVGMRVD